MKSCTCTRNFSLKVCEGNIGKKRDLFIFEDKPINNLINETVPSVLQPPRLDLRPTFIKVPFSEKLISGNSGQRDLPELISQLEC